MDHGYMQNKLSAYHDRSLTPEEMRMVEEHVAACAECREQLEMLVRLDKLVEDKAALGDSDYWETAAQRIETRLGFEEEPKVTDVRRSWAGLGWKLAAAAASVAALTFVALHEGDILDSAREKTDRKTEFVKPASPMLHAPTAGDTADRGAVYQESTAAEAEIAVHRSPDLTTAGATDAETSEDKAEQIAEAIRLYAERPEKRDEPAPKSVAKKMTPDERPSGAGAEPEARDAIVGTTADDEAPSPPVKIVDDLLKQTSGAATNAAGEVSVRGGRAGAAVVVDTVPDRPAEVESDQEAKNELMAGDQVVVSRESLLVADDSLDLNHWRAVRDSLQPLVMLQKVYPSKAAEETTNKFSRPVPSPAAAPAYLSSLADSSNILERYLKACYQVALQTDVESEYEAAVAVLSGHAEDKDSPGRDTARQYLNLLKKQK